MNWTVFQIHDLSGGMLMGTSPFLIERNRPTVIMNFTTDNLGLVEKDFGYSVLGEGITTTSTSTSTTTSSSTSTSTTTTP